MENTTGRTQVIINKAKAEPIAFMHFLLTFRGTNIATAKNAIGDIGECPPEKAEWQYWNGSKFIAGGDDLRVKCLGSAS